MENNILIKKRILKEIEFLCNHNHILGGSLAILLQGYDILRDWNDIDMIVPFYNLEKYEFKNDLINKKIYSNSNVIGHIRRNNIDFEILSGSYSNHKIINYKGFTIKVQDIEEIMRIKLEYSLKGVKKHKKDLRILLSLYKK